MTALKLLSKPTREAANEAWGRMASAEGEKRMHGETHSLFELLVNAYIVQHVPGATVEDVLKARLESTALIGDLDHAAEQLAKWCVTGVDPKDRRKKKK